MASSGSQAGATVVAAAVAPDGAAAGAGIHAGDVLVAVDGVPIARPAEVAEIVHTTPEGRVLAYTVRRGTATIGFRIELQAPPGVVPGLYYSLALVGILAIVVGASVRLRRPHDPATLHFFWLAVAFFGVLSFTPSGRYDRLDYFFEWADLVARLVLPPLFLHFALVFPERPHPWVVARAGRRLLPLIYVPAAVLGLGRAFVVAGRPDGAGRRRWFSSGSSGPRISIWPSVCSAGSSSWSVRSPGFAR